VRNFKNSGVSSKNSESSFSATAADQDTVPTHADVQAELDGLKAMLLRKAQISDPRGKVQATVTVIALHGGRSFRPARQRVARDTSK
jgi:hypothetical protein